MLLISRPGRTDLQLVRCAQSGETAAFNQLVIKYRPRVVQLAMGFTDNAADAEDVAQEAFISAFRGLRHFRCESTFYTWLHRIAINTARGALRSRNREHVDSITDLPNAYDVAHDPARLRDSDTPEALTVTDDVRGMVDVSLAALSETHRAAITLREIDGLTYKEIAAAMAVPVGTVRSRVFRARNFMDRQLRQVCAGGLGRQSK
jgi:RNA polymerase sigma-70 factor, ECF subfamily